MTVSTKPGPLFLSQAILEMLREQYKSDTVTILHGQGDDNPYTYSRQEDRRSAVALFSVIIRSNSDVTLVQVTKIKMPSKELLDFFVSVDERYKDLDISFL